MVDVLLAALSFVSLFVARLAVSDRSISIVAGTLDGEACTYGNVFLVSTVLVNKFETMHELKYHDQIPTNTFHQNGVYR